MREELRLGGDTAGTRLEGATIGFIVREEDKLSTTDQAGTRESGEPVVGFGYYAEKGVRPA